MIYSGFDISVPQEISRDFYRFLLRYSDPELAIARPISDEVGDIQFRIRYVNMYTGDSTHKITESKVKGAVEAMLFLSGLAQGDVLAPSADEDRFADIAESMFEGN